MGSSGQHHTADEEARREEQGRSQQGPGHVGCTPPLQDPEERLEEEVLSLRRREPAGEVAAVLAELRTRR